MSMSKRNRATLRAAACYWRKSPPLLALLAAELLLVASAVWAAVQPPARYTFAPDQLEAIAEDVEYSYDENGYYGVNYDIDGKDILQTPQLSLPAGNYRATVWYAYRPTRTVEGRIHHSNVRLEDDTDSLAVAECDLVLDEGRDSQTVLMSVYRATDTARVVFHNDGGTYMVGGITITQSTRYAVVWALGVLLCCLAVDAMLVCILPGSPLYRGGGAAVSFVVLTGAVVLASAPLLKQGVDLQCVDCIFHLERIEGIVQGLRDGQFPVRLNSAAKSGYGYANSLFYGELFLYIPAILRLLDVSIQDAYRIFTVGIQAATALIAYGSFKPMFGRRAAVLGAVIYLLSPYRLHKLYDLQALGEYTAMTFLPLIAYALWVLYHGQPDASARRRAMLALTFGYTALLQCHMITTELAVFAGAAVALIEWRKTFRKPVLLVWLKAAGLALALNLWFLLPFATVMTSGIYVRITGGGIQAEGLTLAELFSLTQSSTVGLPLLIGGGVSACVLLSFCREARPWRRTCGIALTVGAMAVWMSTEIFPWDAISALPGVGSILRSIQFPWRYSSIATISLTVACLAAAKLAETQPVQIPKSAVLGLCAVLTLGSSIYYEGEVIPGVWPNPVVDTSQLYYNNNYNPRSNIRLAMDGLYLPKDVVETNDGYLSTTNVTSVNLGDFQRENGVTTVTYDEYLGQNGHIEFPLLYYPGYCVAEGEGTIFMTANGLVGVVVPANSSGTLSVAFREPKRWLLADLVSFSAALALAGYAVYHRRKTLDTSTPISGQMSARPSAFNKPEQIV